MTHAPRRASRRWTMLLVPPALAVLLAAASLWGLSAQRGVAFQAGASLPITGTMVMAGSGDEGEFTGTVTSLIASTETGALALSGVISGDGELDSGSVAVGEVAFTAAVEPAVRGANDASPAAASGGQAGGSCDLLTLALDPFPVGKDAELQEAEITLDLAESEGDVELLPVLLCGLAGLLVTSDATPIPGADPTSTPLPSAQTPIAGGAMDNVTAAVRDTLNQIFVAAGVGSPEIPPIKPTNPIGTVVSDPATAFGIEPTPTPMPSA